jgi:hypothetical protein
MLPARFHLRSLSFRRRQRAAAPPAEVTAERPSFGRLVHVSIAGMFGGGLLGALLGAFVASLGYVSFDSVALAVGIYAGLAAGGWCGLVIAPAALCARRPGRMAATAILIGAGLGALAGTYCGKLAYHVQWYPATLTLLGGFAGAGEGLALYGGSRWLWRRWQVATVAPPSAADPLPDAALPARQETAPAIDCGSGHAMEQAVPLRRQALRLGRATICVRFALPAAGAVVAIGATSHVTMRPWEVPIVIVGFLPFVVGLALVGLPISFGLAALCRRWSLRRLRRQLAPLPLEERRELLLALNQSTAPEIREMSAPLLHELSSRGGELTPAASPEGRGDELGA